MRVSLCMLGSLRSVSRLRASYEIPLGVSMHPLAQNEGLHPAKPSESRALLYHVCSSVAADGDGVDLEEHGGQGEGGHAGEGLGRWARAPDPGDPVG
jgi:hypothetical protein